MDAMSFVKQIKNLPTLPAVLGKIRGAVEDPDTTAERVVDALKLDPVTAGKVIHLANSAYLGVTGKISSLKNAVLLLGLPRIRSLVVVSHHISPVVKENPEAPFSLERYWRHSVAVGLIAESIARHYQRYGAIDEQEAFSAGLLHDIGKLALAVYKAPLLTSAYEESVKASVPVYMKEDPPWSHTAVGTLLAALWNFPPELSGAIFAHHAPAPEAEHARIVAIVHVADVMVHTVGLSTFPDEAVPPVDEKALETVRLPPERLRIIAETAMDTQKKIEEDCVNR